MKKIAWSVLMSLVLIASTGVSVVDAGTWSDRWVNSNGFTSNCLGYTDNYPSSMYAQAATLFTTLGFSSIHGGIGAVFTRSAVLASLSPASAMYIHSHGDVYYSGGAAFSQDPGVAHCNSTSDHVTADQVNASAYPPYNLVYMSTCYLGSANQPHSKLANMMPEAFRIPKTRILSGNTFYEGYEYETYDSSAYQFEGNFLAWMQAYGGNSYMSAADTYASSFYYQPGGPNDPFMSMWYGSYYAKGNL